MKIKKYHTLTSDQKCSLLELWNHEYPAHLAYADIDAFQSYLDNLIEPEHLLLETETGEIKGWYFHFTRNEEKWFAIILSVDIQGQKMGTALLEKARETQTELNGWVVDQDLYKKRDGTPYPSPLGFYLKNGFKLLEEERLELDILSAIKIRWRK